MSCLPGRGAGFGGSSTASEKLREMTTTQKGARFSRLMIRGQTAFRGRTGHEELPMICRRLRRFADWIPEGFRELVQKRLRGGGLVLETVRRIPSRKRSAGEKPAQRANGPPRRGERRENMLRHSRPRLCPCRSSKKVRGANTWTTLQVSSWLGRAACGDGTALTPW